VFQYKTDKIPSASSLNSQDTGSRATPAITRKNPAGFYRHRGNFWKNNLKKGEIPEKGDFNHFSAKKMVVKIL